MTSSSETRRIGYREKYVRSGTGEPGSGEARFLGYLESLNESEWEDLLTDLLAERPEALDVIRAPRGFDALLHGAQFFGRLGSPSRSLMRGATHRLLQRLKEDDSALQHRRKGGELEVRKSSLGKLLTLCSLVPGSCAPSLLMLIALDESSLPDIRFRAGSALAGQAEGAPLVFWIDVNLAKFPELTPAVLAVLSEKAPRLALDRFRSLSSPPSRQDRLEYPLRVIFRKIQSTEAGLEALRVATSGGSDWANKLLWKVLSFAEFTELRSLLLEVAGSHDAELSRLIGCIARYATEGEQLWEEGVEHGQQFCRALSANIDKWQPFTLHSAGYSLRLLSLVRAPLLEDLPKLILSLEQALLRLERPFSDGSSVRDVVRAVIKLVVQAPLGWPDLLASRFRSYEVFEVYMRSLHKALPVCEFGALALEELIRHISDEGKVLLVVRSALFSDNWLAVDVLEVLEKYYGAEACREFLSKTLRLSADPSGFPIPEEEMVIAAKLYDLDPSLTPDDAVSRMLVNDACVPGTYVEMVGQVSALM